MPLKAAIAGSYQIGSDRCEATSGTESVGPQISRNGQREHPDGMICVRGVLLKGRLPTQLRALLLFVTLIGPYSGIW